MTHENDPADIILDRVMPNASPEEREEARTNLYRLARALARIRSLPSVPDHEKAMTPQNWRPEVDSDSSSPSTP